MVEKSLKQLRKEREKLKKRFEGVREKNERKKLDNLERRELKREIRALKHPQSSFAIASFLKSAKKNTAAAGRFIKRRADIFDENLKRADIASRKSTGKRVVSTGKKKTKKKTRKK